MHLVLLQIAAKLVSATKSCKTWALKISQSEHSVVLPGLRILVLRSAKNEKQWHNVYGPDYR